MLNRSITLYTDEKELNVNYSCIRDPPKLPNNRRTVVSMTTKLDQRLKKEGNVQGSIENMVGAEGL